MGAVLAATGSLTGREIALLAEKRGVSSTIALAPVILISF
jgi:hypothetical protein